MIIKRMNFWKKSKEKKGGQNFDPRDTKILGVKWAIFGGFGDGIIARAAFGLT